MERENDGLKEQQLQNGSGSTPSGSLATLPGGDNLLSYIFLTYKHPGVTFTGVLRINGSLEIRSQLSIHFSGASKPLKLKFEFQKENKTVFSDGFRNNISYDKLLNGLRKGW